MSSIIRRFQREQLKHELGTNKINNEWHKRYGYTPNVGKLEKKIFERFKKKLNKALYKFLRNKKKVNDEGRS